LCCEHLGSPPCLREIKWQYVYVQNIFVLRTPGFTPMFCGVRVAHFTIFCVVFVLLCLVCRCPVSCELNVLNTEN
jgi:hypothetical protein